MKKSLTVLLSLLMILSLAACTASEKTLSLAVREEPVTEVQQQFDDFLLDEYKLAVSEDALTLHYSLIDPSVYGIELDEISLGTLGLDTIDEDNQEFYETLEKLNSFDRDELNQSQKEDYDLLKAYMELSEAFIGLEYYGALFAPASSVTSNLVTNFTEYRFYDEEDIEQYLILLSDVERYLQEALNYTAKQVEMGLFMSDGAIDGTLEEINKFISKIESNELIVTFNTKVEQAGFLSDVSRNDFIHRNKAIVIDSIIPAYQNVKDILESYRGTGMQAGYASLPEGKAYYEALVRMRLGYQGSIDDLFEEGEEMLMEASRTIISLMQKDASVYDRYVNSADYFAQKEPMEILKDLEELLLKEYPQGPEVTYTAEYLDPSVANASTVAYYVIPPLDNITENVIKINPAHAQDDMETLYTSLAHEGFPGHCYQNTYYYNTNPHPIRTVVDFLGYGEGWAMKVELEALNWILSADENLASFLACDTTYAYLIQSMIDLGVNYYGWDQIELKAWLQEYGAIYGLDNDEAVEMLYHAVIDDPGLLIPYGFGLMKMTELKEDAMDELGRRFNPVEYHKLLLETGPMTFDLLEKKVDEWIDLND